MLSEFILKRTTTTDPDFQLLIRQLDHELWNELKEDQATYDPHNKVAGISTAVLIYTNQQPVASGCFKPFNNSAVEIKRMFVQKPFRGKGLSKKILQELEKWAKEEGYQSAVLETSIHFKVACGLYQQNGYRIIPNYPPYVGLTDSVCMQKSF